MKRKFMRTSHSLKPTVPNGMGFLADLLLLYMSEEDAFWLLVELLKGAVHAPMEELYLAKGDEEIEIRVRVRVQKSKVSRSYKQADFEIIFGEEVSKLVGTGKRQSSAVLKR
ncbi:uncharacterized protein LOC103495083 isoform X4 [Cucumis melo]|uniref:Uncharacterized protein LOC103495083 isoform X4 n=1 Tax=Cucumis melo TaxID=3656 RepID=A0ABM3L9B3_CUCME|nr:uncharacterized protein LOC103495083 isoform X4 [Cucumis melo]XP_050946596.1 uncharacterized protein LOC103495083 isoform X4 [Cucumis melo]